LSQKDKFGYIKDKYSEITGQKIDKVLVFTTSNLIDFTNLIGGVDIYLEKGFTDNQYPNPDYIKNPSPKIPIYKTVSFPSGWVKLNSSNITEFVRSRKSAQTAAEGGTDIGRIYRQQLLIDAIMAKIKTPSFYKSPKTLINLYNFWHQKIETDIKDDDLISLALKMKKQALNLSISKTTLPVGATAQDGVIYHPDTFINKQWVFIPSLKDYSSVHNFINTALSQ
ncbi:MAG TPA: LCP family protein, partial [Patescibacteria group bacterium]